MDSNDFRVKITLRVVAIALTIYLFIYLIDNNTFFITTLLALGLIVYQLISLINYLDKTNKAIAAFFESIKNDDFSAYTARPDEGPYLDHLKSEFNNVMQKLSEARAKKEAQYHYLKNIVQHVGIGIITFNKTGNVQIMNTAAKKLLKIDQVQNIEELKTINPILVKSFKKLRTGGRDLLKLETGGDIVQLSVYAIELALHGEEFKLISIQNIHSELEENEMEAWQKLVRVLTHEIMNSVTPISSLANTVEGEMLGYIDDCGDKPHCDISVEELNDMHLAVKTIQRRSEGLIRFVSDFRNLTHIPNPKFKLVQIKDILAQIHVLMKHELKENNINYQHRIEPENSTINADAELIQQVLINLIKNAIQALSDQENKKIEVNAYQDEKSRVIISVKDNGPGIEEEAQSKIFIQFFTTKKQGSGIGLSLSRQIMRKHLGAISVKSKINEGTEFLLKF